ncbi:hypothetical protein E2C01_087133 [Portunus trituberculatus]|uniref:Uncharacterized protein n=1 Tax=Portunus trituberculatus TaxID=210409 RepID=A0A5B7J2J9_PORTR|nr:hypothetical protein [Portunus trituberculatus]
MLCSGRGASAAFVCGGAFVGWWRRAAGGGQASSRCTSRGGFPGQGFQVVEGGSETRRAGNTRSGRREARQIFPPHPSSSSSSSIPSKPSRRETTIARRV